MPSMILGGLLTLRDKVPFLIPTHAYNPLSRTCTTDGWRWMNPRIHGSVNHRPAVKLAGDKQVQK